MWSYKWRWYSLKGKTSKCPLDLSSCNDENNYLLIKICNVNPEKTLISGGLVTFTTDNNCKPIKYHCPYNTKCDNDDDESLCSQDTLSHSSCDESQISHVSHKPSMPHKPHKPSCR